MSSNKEYLPYLARVYRWLPVNAGSGHLVSRMKTEYLENIKECMETGGLVPHEFLRCEPEETLTAQLWIEVIEYELSHRAPKRGIWWLAVEYDDIAQMLCPPNIYKTACFALYEGKRHVEHMHVTLAFDVTEEEVPEMLTYYEGKCGVVSIRVKGLAHNSKCACLVVDIGDTDCCNKHPHITLALAEGVQPVYSNDMLAGKDGPYTYLPLEATLEGRLEFKPFD